MVPVAVEAVWLELEFAHLFRRDEATAIRGRCRAGHGSAHVLRHPPADTLDATSALDWFAREGAVATAVAATWVRRSGLVQPEEVAQLALERDGVGFAVDGCIAHFFAFSFFMVVFFSSSTASPRCSRCRRCST